MAKICLRLIFLLLPSWKWLSSAPTGCHRAWPSVVSVLVTCPTSEHHVVGCAVPNVLQSWCLCCIGTSQTLHVPTLNLLYMWTLSLLCPILSLNRMTCSCLFSLWSLSDWLKFGCCCLHFFFLGDGFHDGLFICVRSISVLLVQLASFPSKPVCLFISKDRAVCWNPQPGLGLSGLWGQPGQFPPHWYPPGGDFGGCWGQREHLRRWPQ